MCPFPAHRLPRDDVMVLVDLEELELWVTRDLDAVRGRHPWMEGPDLPLIGDVFLDWTGATRAPDTLGEGLSAAAEGWRLKMITNRGVKVWPGGIPETFCTDHWRCRFVPDGNHPVANRDIVGLLGKLDDAGFDTIKTEHLYAFDGTRGYSLGQGE